MVSKMAGRKFKFRQNEEAEEAAESAEPPVPRVYIADFIMAQGRYDLQFKRWIRDIFRGTF